MRICYTGLDNRTRVAECNRVKFLEDGYQPTDTQAEYDDRLTGPIIVAHTYRSKGGKRVTMTVPPGYNMAAAQKHLLENNWLDLTDCTVKVENLYT